MDRWLFFAVAALLGVGITMVLSTSYLYSQEHFSDGIYLFRKQLISIGIGSMILLVAAVASPAAYRRAAIPLLFLTLIALTLTLIPGIGLDRGGARRWLPLGFFVFQPAELAKLSVVLYMAHSLARKQEKVRTFSFGVLPYLVMGALFQGLILLEPDFGAAFLLGVMIMLMLFVAGARLSHLFGTGLAALPAVVFLLMADYRLQRLLTFLDPWADASRSGFQIIQSYIAFGSGQLWGRGLGQSRQKLFYLPGAHTDFIYSVIGEELGLFGALIVLVLFAIIVLRGFRLALGLKDPFSQHLAFGLTSLLALQAFIHVGVVMGLMPTKGLVLPFISYGGSAMVVHMLSVGMLLGLSGGRNEK